MKWILVWTVDGETTETGFATCSDAVEELKSRLMAAKASEGWAVCEWEIPNKSWGRWAR